MKLVKAHENSELAKGPRNPKDKNKVIGLGKSNEVSKKPIGVWN